MKLLCVKEIASMLNVKPSTVYAWAERGTLPSYKIGGLLRFSEEEIIACIKNCKSNPDSQYNITADKRPKKGG